MIGSALLELDPRVCAAIQPYFSEKFGNASSVTHSFGTDAGEAVAAARRAVGVLIGAPDERGVVFTSGAGESHRLVAERLDARLTVHGADANTGELTPLAESAARAVERGVSLHCDATWRLGRGELDVSRFGIDLLSIDGSALGAPAGVGALWVRRRSVLCGLAARRGSSLQSELRPGTLNVPAIVALGVAADLARTEAQSREDLATPLLDALTSAGARALGPLVGQRRLWGHVSVELPGLGGDAARRLSALSPPHRRLALRLVGDSTATFWIARHATAEDVDVWAAWFVEALRLRAS